MIRKTEARLNVPGSIDWPHWGPLLTKPPQGLLRAENWRPRLQVGKGTVQVAAMLRKKLVCFMKQKGQGLSPRPWEGRCCPSRVAQGSS